MRQLFEATYSTPRQAAQLRHGLSDALLADGVARNRVDLAAVMISELMDNALRHTDTRNPVVVAYLGESVLQVAVKDVGIRLPVVHPIDGQRVGGNGMRIVDAWAASWGTVVHDGLGKTVWFSLDVGSTG